MSRADRIPLHPDHRLLSLFKTCETVCVIGCCGIDALDFSPLNIAYDFRIERHRYKDRWKELVEQQIQTIVYEIDWIVERATRLTPDKDGYVGYIEEVNEVFTLPKLVAFTEMIKKNLLLAPDVFAYSAQLSDETHISDIRESFNDS